MISHFRTALVKLTSCNVFSSPEICLDATHKDGNFDLKYDIKYSTLTIHVVCLNFISIFWFISSLRVMEVKF